MMLFLLLYYLFKQCFSKTSAYYKSFTNQQLDTDNAFKRDNFRFINPYLTNNPYTESLCQTHLSDVETPLSFVMIIKNYGNCLKRFFTPLKSLRLSSLDTSR